MSFESFERFVADTPFFSDEHQRLAAGVRDFVAREIEPRVYAVDDWSGDVNVNADAQEVRSVIGLLAQADLLRFAVAGGSGDGADDLDMRSLCLVREALAYSSAVADLSLMTQGRGAYALGLAAPEHLKKFWLPRVRDGKAIAAFALTEPDAGSDIAALATTARRDGDSYVLNGRKRFISHAGIADFYTVFARTVSSTTLHSNERDSSAISAFIVGARTPGFRLVEQISLLTPHPLGEIEFVDLRVPVENRIGAEGEGFGLAMKTMDAFRASVGAAACGMARRALEESLAYAKKRQQFGAPLAQFQMVQERLAEMVTELDAARLLVYRAAYRRDVGRETATRAASEAKLFATEAACRIVDNAVQLHGASGLLRESTVARLYRDVRSLRIYEGTSEIQKLIIANQLLKE